MKIPWTWFRCGLGLGLAWGALAQPAPVRDFHLQDVNPNSPRYQDPVSPRDYLLQVSGYYFGSAG